MFTTTIIPRHRSRAPQGLSAEIADPFEWIDHVLKTDWTGYPSHFGNQLKYDEKSKSYTTELNVAGYKKDEIKVEVEEDTVIITAENEKRGRASRSFYVSEADPDNVRAKLEDGVLTVSIARRPEKTPRKIPIFGG